MSGYKWFYDLMLDLARAFFLCKSWLGIYWQQVSWSLTIKIPFIENVMSMQQTEQDAKHYQFIPKISRSKTIMDVHSDLLDIQNSDHKSFLFKMQ